jgi:hypothetical protein
MIISLEEILLKRFPDARDVTAIDDRRNGFGLDDLPALWINNRVSVAGPDAVVNDVRTTSGIISVPIISYRIFVIEN